MSLVDCSLAKTDLPPTLIKFDIAQYSVADALILFAEQSGEQIIFRHKDTFDIPARRISGLSGPVEMLKKILKNTGLEAHRNQEGIIVIRKNPDFTPAKATTAASHPKEKKHPIAVKEDSVIHKKQKTEELIITGSRIKRAELSTPNLVSIIEAKTIRRTGTVNIEELLNKLPQITPSLTGNSNNPGNGTATVDLRGLGPERTLVLLNGRRYVPSNQDGVVDLNTIPTFLLDKIEVATGGTSAVYGAGAIAGVVNFRLRDDFDGFEGLARYRLSKYGDGDKYDANLVYGQSFSDDRGSAFLHIGALRRQAILQGDRDFSAFTLRDSFIKPGSKDPRFGFGEFLAREDGGTPGLVSAGSGIIPGGRVIGIQQNGPHPGLQKFGPNGEALPYNSVTDSFNFAPFNFLQLPQTRLSATFGAKYRLTNNVKIFNQVVFSQNKVNLELAHTPFFIDNLIVPIDNPFLHESAKDALRGIDWYETGQIWQARNANGNPIFNATGNPVQARQAVTITQNPDGNIATKTPLWAIDGSPIAATGANTAQEAGNLLFIADGQAEIPRLFRRMTELGPRQVKNNRQSLNIVLGLEGELAQNWDFVAHYNYNQYKNTRQNINAVSTKKFLEAIDIIPSANGYICRNILAVQDGCVPANIFGEGNLSQEAVDYITVSQQENTRYTRQIATAYINGTIDYGVSEGMTLLFGTDWRSEKSNFTGNTENTSNLGNGFILTSPANGGYHVWSLFSEFKLPLIENIPVIKNFGLSGALRYSNYNLSGTAWATSVGFNWLPVSDLRLRGQYQRAIREPSIENLFTKEITVLYQIKDPCTANNINSYGNISDFCVKSGVPEDLVGNFGQLTSIVKEISSGNINLEMEKSDIYTFGLIYQPSYLPEIQLAVDYYHITLSNQIAAFPDGVQGIVDSCFQVNNSHAPSCEKIFRTPDGQLDFIDGSLTNIGQTKTSGIDGQLFYQKKLARGLFGKNEQIELTFQGSYLINFEWERLSGSAAFNCAGVFSGVCENPLPKIRFTQFTTWRNDKMELSIRWRHIGGIRNSNPMVKDIAVAKLPAKNYFDLYVQYNLSGSIVVRSGVDNIFNVTPDFVGTGQQQANTFPNIYDVLGSYFHFGVNIFY